MTHYYDILGLPPGVSKAEIKEAYHRLCQECHPDKLPPDTPKKARQIVEEHFKQINEAYAVHSLVLVSLVLFWRFSGFGWAGLVVSLDS